MSKLILALQYGARATAVAVAFIVFTLPANAQSKPSAAAMKVGEQLVNATGAGSIFNPLIPGVVEQAKLVFLQQNPGLAKDLNEVAAKLRDEYASRQAELNKYVASLYAQRFTVDELKKLLAFYQSPLGKKLLEQQPRIVDTSMSYAQDWANKLSSKVIDKFREEMKKRGHDL